MITINQRAWGKMGKNREKQPAASTDKF